jgi:hypothetical protein
MALSSEAKKPAAAVKTKPPVTLKHLAAALAEQHQLTKRAGEALLGDLVGKITKHLKKGERVRIAGLGPHTSKHGELSADEHAVVQTGLNEHFYRYLLAQAHNAQFLVIENDAPPPRVKRDGDNVHRAFRPGWASGSILNGPFVHGGGRSGHQRESLACADRRFRFFQRSPASPIPTAVCAHRLRFSQCSGHPPADKRHNTRARQAYSRRGNIRHTVRYIELSPARFKDFTIIRTRVEPGRTNAHGSQHR